MAVSDPSSVLRVLRGLLRPLVRMLIARGVTAPALYRLLKEVFVEVAHADFRLDGRPPTDSRVSLLTGVHRRDVRAILEAEGDGWEAARAKTAVFATVLGRWLTRQPWADAQGRPQPLARSGEDGRDFETLVREINRDIRPRTVLDELMRQGLVEEDDAGLLRLTPQAVAGPVADGDRIVFFAANVGDHLAAAAENLMADRPPFLERAVFYTRLTGPSVDGVEARARVLSQAVLEELNRDSAALQQADADDPGNTQRYRFGVYFYREDSAPGAGETRP
jgi:hypothetical protein